MTSNLMYRCLIIFILFLLIGGPVPAQQYFYEVEELLQSNTPGHAMHVIHEYAKNLIDERDIEYQTLRGGDTEQYDSYLIGDPSAKMLIVVPLKEDSATLAFFAVILDMVEKHSDNSFAVLFQSTLNDTATEALYEQFWVMSPPYEAVIFIGEHIGSFPLIVQSGTPLNAPRHLFATIKRANTEAITIVYQGVRLIESVNRQFWESDSASSQWIANGVPAVVFAGAPLPEEKNLSTDIDSGTVLYEREGRLMAIQSLIERIAWDISSSEKVDRIRWQFQFLSLQYALFEPLFLTEIQLYLVSLVFVAFCLFVLIFFKKGVGRRLSFLWRHKKEMLVITSILLVSVLGGTLLAQGVLSLGFGISDSMAILLQLLIFLSFFYTLYPFAVYILRLKKVSRFLTSFALLWIFVSIFLQSLVSISFIFHGTLVAVMCFVFALVRTPRGKILCLILAVIPLLVDIAFARYLRYEELAHRLVEDPLLGSIVLISFTYPFICMLARCELLFCKRYLYVSHFGGIICLFLSIFVILTTEGEPSPITAQIVETVDTNRQTRSLSVDFSEDVGSYTFVQNGIWYAGEEQYEVFELPYTDYGTEISILNQHSKPLYRYQFDYTAVNPPNELTVSFDSDIPFLLQNSTLLSEQTEGEETTSLRVIRRFPPPVSRSSVILSSITEPNIRVQLIYPAVDVRVNTEKDVVVTSIRNIIYEQTAQ